MPELRSSGSQAPAGVLDYVLLLQCNFVKLIFLRFCSPACTATDKINIYYNNAHLPGLQVYDY